MPDRWVEEFKRVAVPVIRERFSPTMTLLFGSRIRGNPRPDSDLDAIIVSPAFEGTPFIKRAGQVLRAVRFPKHVDFFCYSPEEFARAKQSSAVVMDALEYAVAV
jgi:predicted nucleotidyltransferase